MSKYVIVDAEVIEKRIAELEEIFAYQAKHGHGKLCHETNLQLTELKHVLSQSTLLIPEIEKAFDEGFYLGVEETNDEHEMEDAKQDYILNLKINI